MKPLLEDRDKFTGIRLTNELLIPTTSEAGGKRRSWEQRLERATNQSCTMRSRRLADFFPRHPEGDRGGERLNGMMRVSLHARTFLILCLV